MIVAKKNLGSFNLYLRTALDFREIIPSDAGTMRVQVLVLESKGKGNWETFHGSHIEMADIGQVGETFADVYLLGSHKPVRFKHSTKKIMIRSK